MENQNNQNAPLQGYEFERIQPLIGSPQISTRNLPEWTEKTVRRINELSREVEILKADSNQKNDLIATLLKELDELKVKVIRLEAEKETQAQIIQLPPRSEK